MALYRRTPAALNGNAISFLDSENGAKCKKQQEPDVPTGPRRSRILGIPSQHVTHAPLFLEAPDRHSAFRPFPRFAIILDQEVEHPPSYRVKAERRENLQSSGIKLGTVTVRSPQRTKGGLCKASPVTQAFNES